MNKKLSGGGGEEEEEEEEEEEGEDVVMEEVVQSSAPDDMNDSKKLDKKVKAVSESNEEKMKDLIEAGRLIGAGPRVLASFDNVRDYIADRLLSNSNKKNHPPKLKLYLGAVKFPSDLYAISPAQQESFLGMVGTNLSQTQSSWMQLLDQARQELAQAKGSSSSGFGYATKRKRKY